MSIFEKEKKNGDNNSRTCFEVYVPFPLHGDACFQRGLNLTLLNLNEIYAHAPEQGCVRGRLSVFNYPFRKHRTIYRETRYYQTVLK